MNKSEIKTIWKLTKAIWIGSFVFWIVETVIFLIVEGWHLKATNPIEISLDKVVSEMWTVALWLTVYCSLMLIFNLNKSK